MQAVSPEVTVGMCWSVVPLWSRFTAEQLRALGMLPVKELYKTLEMFVRWINDCLYDFHELPFAVKRPLPPSVPRWFEERVAEKSASGE